MVIEKDFLVIGLGNPILSDDGVGWVVAEQLRAKIKNPKVDFLLLTLGGLRLMERLVGYRHVIIIDAVVTGQHPPGYILQFPLADFPDPSAGHTTSVHDTSLLNAIRVGREMGLDLPEEIDVIAVESVNIKDFSERLTPHVADAVPRAVQLVNQ